MQYRLASRRPDDSRLLVVSTTAGGRGERVVACCAGSVSGGVRPGMPLSEARAVLLGPVGAGGESVEGLEVVEADEEADLRCLAEEGRRAWRFTPLVSLAPAARPGQVTGQAAGQDPRSRPESLLANITGCSHLFGDERGLARAMHEEWSGRGFSVRVAVAGSPGTAWAIAHSAHWTGQPWVPLVASPGRDELWMRRLPIEALALRPSVVRSLSELDVARVDRLLDLPAAEIKRRFGEETLGRIDRALGRWQEPLECLPMPDPVVACRSFDYPVSRADWLQEALRELVREVACGLKRRGRVTWRLVCRVQSEVSQSEPEWVEWVTGLVEPSQKAEHLWELVSLQSERRRWPAEVVRLEVLAQGVVVPERPQQTLFKTETEYEATTNGGVLRRGMARLVERLSSRLGETSVSRPVLCEAEVPESAVMLVRVGRERSVERSGEEPWFGAVTRPLRLLEGPRPIEVMAVVPEGPPIRFAWESRTQRVVRYWGPERIETGWWAEGGVARDYYRVETDAGEWYWLFRRRGDDRWFVHGVFE